MIFLGSVFLVVILAVKVTLSYLVAINFAYSNITISYGVSLFALPLPISANAPEPHRAVRAGRRDVY